MEHRIFDTPPGTVALFVTCMVDMMYPQVGVAAVELLERHGVRVVFPEAQTCCGQPAFNAGYHDEAAAMARHFLEVFFPLVEKGEVEAIVVPSGSCGTMTSHFYAHLLHEAAEPRLEAQARALGRVTFELTQFLVDVLKVDHLDCSFPGQVTYHACCHLLRELRVHRQPRRLLANSPLDFVEMEGSEECCGFGGLFAVKNEPISTAMGNAKLDYIEASGAETVVMCDVSCMTHLQGLAQRQQRACRALHIAEVLAAQESGTADSAPPAPVPEAQPQAGESDSAPRRWQDITAE